MSSHIKFSPEILSRLGEELIPNPEQGIIELVKNSYDADAKTCTVKLVPNNEGDIIEVIISDTGNGMNEKAIQDGWLILGKSAKATERRPAGKFARFPVGDKGLGRLSALRQGEEVLLLTRPESEPGWEYSVRIFWAQFASVQVVEDVDIIINKQATEKQKGTEIHIKGIKNKLKKNDIERLARDLVLLSDPFKLGSNYSFYVELVAPGFADLEKIVKDGYFEDADYHLLGFLTNGHASAKVVDWKGDTLYSADHGKITKSRENYNSVDAIFELWVYLLGSKTSFSSRRNPISKIKEWLSIVGGVHIYHRGVRVKPYGDPGNDWLEMNLKRVKSPEERPSINNSIGIVVVDDPDDILVPKTDRMGFLESEAYYELKQFCEDCLDWMAKERLKVAEQRRKKEREQKPKAIATARKKIDEIIENKLPDESKPEVKKAVDDLQLALDTQLKTLREDLQLYRSLATAGALIVRFAHQTKHPISNIIRVTTLVETIGQKLATDINVSSHLFKSVEILRRSAKIIQDYSIVPINLLKYEKRRVGVVYVHSVISNVIQMLTPFIEAAQIKVDVYSFNGEICLNGSDALLEGILTNFFTNSITALTEIGRSESSIRQIHIYTDFSQDLLTLRFLDSGPGISLDMEEIWLPGRTTTENGTGFGLTIVKDSIIDLGGKVSALQKGQLGGAEFVVELPAFLSLQGRLL